jgi:anti-anti-sigma factor
MPHSRLRLQHTSMTDGITVLAADGEIDFHGTAALERAITTPPSMPPRVVVDLAQTTFMDSGGINALIRANRTVSRAGGWIRLAGLAENVLSVVQLVGLDQVITVYPALDVALREAA